MRMGSGGEAEDELARKLRGTVICTLQNCGHLIKRCVTCIGCLFVFVSLCGAWGVWSPA